MFITCFLSMLCWCVQLIQLAATSRTAGVGENPQAAILILVASRKRFPQLRESMTPQAAPDVAAVKSECPLLVRPTAPTPVPPNPGCSGASVNMDTASETKSTTHDLAIDTGKSLKLKRPRNAAIFSKRKLGMPQPLRENMHE